jgi:GNAT superfamily N-acetyltransferase
VVNQMQLLTCLPEPMFILSKLIDGEPRNGTHMIMGQRIMNFLDLRRRQNFYEPLSSYKTVWGALVLRWRVDHEMYPDEDKRDRIGVTFPIWEGACTAADGVIAEPGPDERYVGLHAVDVTGWHEAGETLVFRNSWGPGWGRRGYGSVSRAYLERHLYDAWRRSNARHGFTAWDRDAIETATSQRELAAAWLRENPRKRTRFPPKGRTEIWTYETWSLEDDIPVSVIEVRSLDSQRLAWATLFHQADHLGIVKELYVWPAFRRLGYGRLLQAAIENVADGWGERSLQVYFHSADALPRNRGAGRVFGQTVGYQWQWRRRTHPNLDAVGVKTL